MVGYLPSRPPCKQGVSLSKHTSLGVGGAADIFFTPQTLRELRDEMEWLQSRNIPFNILGGGTNVACRDKTFKGAIINTKVLNRAWHEGLRIKALSGCSLAMLVKRCCELGLSGLEPLVGIPGTIGGAVIMNAGGRHGNIGLLVEEVRALSPEGEERVYARPADRFGYRKGDFNGDIITEVVLKLKVESPSVVRKRVCTIMREKFAVQPLSARSAGCVFKNPQGESAGRLIDRCGLKGRCAGGMKISPVHANFIINESGGSFENFMELAGMAQDRVRENFGVEMEYEIKVF